MSLASFRPCLRLDQRLSGVFVRVAREILPCAWMGMSKSMVHSLTDVQAQGLAPLSPISVDGPGCSTPTSGETDVPHSSLVYNYNIVYNRNSIIA